MTNLDSPRNIHAIPPKPADFEDAALNCPRGTTDFSQSLESQHSTINSPLPRLRARTNDPAREYAARPGEVEPIADSVAALILCHKGWARIERQEIKVTMEGTEYLFASRESVTIAQHNGTGRRVLWVLNRLSPHVLHILSDTGGYVESIPRKGQAQWFSQDEASQAARGDAQAMLQRDMRRLRELHREDSASAAADTAHNAAQTRRIVRSFPAPDARETAPAQAAQADDIAAAMRNAEEQRECAVRAEGVRERLEEEEEEEDEEEKMPARVKPGAALGAIARALREQAAADF